MSLFRSPRPTGVRRHDEGGSVIIIVMAFILVIGVIALALLSFSFTATKSQAVFRADRVIRNNAESALITTVERLRMNPLMATDANSSGTPPLDSACNLNFPMQEDTSNGTKATVTSTSVLQVTCGPTTPYNTSGTYGVQSGSGGVDADGGQRPRDVTITVTCKGERARAQPRRLRHDGHGADRGPGPGPLRHRPQRDARQLRQASGGPQDRHLGHPALARRTGAVVDPALPGLLRAFGAAAGPPYRQQPVRVEPNDS